MTTPLAAMIFAAGRGTRMAPLTDRLPKPMIRVAGRPLVDHALDLLRNAGVGRIVANLHHLPEALEPHLSAQGVATIREPRLLETGGGLKNARQVLGGGAVVTINSDAVWSGPNPLTRMLSRWNPAFMDALLCLVRVENALGHTGIGDFLIASDGRLCRGPGTVYTGLQIINTDRLDEISDSVFSLNVVWDRIGADERLFGLVHDGPWCDVGRPENLPLAEGMLDV